TVINLDGCIRDLESAKLVAKELKSPGSAVHTLGLRFNHLSAEGLQSLLEAIAKNTKLEALYIQSFPQDPTVLKAFHESWLKNGVRHSHHNHEQTLYRKCPK
ncbi:unnamed protein product, partial [Discosporangium mesarthrocarpum]